MLVLGLESSCDETAAALISCSHEKHPAVLAEAVSSQIELHARYGGVVPELASREHLRNFPLVVQEVLERAKVTMKEVTHVGVTSGPGLKGCLLIGVGVARGIAMGLGIPMLGVNHIEGHLLAARLEQPSLEFPYLALVVSGGHTELVVVRALGEYEVLARTCDDAAGEAFDKSAHLLGLEYPGGPALSKLAASADSELRKRFFAELPKVMRESEGFSFSGLKTAVALFIKRHGEKSSLDERAAMAAAIQDSIVDALVFKLKGAVKNTGLNQVVVTGGVAANSELRRRVEQLPKIRAIFPSPQRCVDNASMIGLVAALRYMAGQAGSYSPQVLSRWPVEECLQPVRFARGGPQ